MEGHSEGPKQGDRRISSTPPAPASHHRRKMISPALELPQGIEMNYASLHQILLEKKRSVKHISAVRIAYLFGEQVHEGTMRKGAVGGKKEPYFVHCANVAYRCLRKELSDAAACAALLHDTIEDTNTNKPGEAGKTKPVDATMIAEIFKGAPVAPAFGNRVAQLVVLLTKPKFSAEKEWIFADDPLYYQIKDCYDGTLYDQRSTVYYKHLQDSGDLEGIAIKFFDNLHNAETMQGIPNANRQKNFRTMANNSLELARLIFTEEEFRYVVSTFEQWGFKLPPTTEKAQPRDILVQFPPRAHISRETLQRHPDPTAAYVSIYGSIYDAFLTGSVEVGFPPDLKINYRAELERCLPPGLFCEQAKSMVPKTFPMHEVIFKISGFDIDGSLGNSPSPVEQMQLSLPNVDSSHNRRHPHTKRPRMGIRPSPYIAGFVDILDEKGEVVVSLSESAFTPNTIAFGSGLQKEFNITHAKYAALQDSLRRFFSEVLIPELERAQSVLPQEPNNSG